MNILRAFIDVETTGLDPKLHGVWQISGILQRNEEVLETFCIEQNVFAGQLIDPKALEIGGIDETYLTSRQPAVTGYQELVRSLRRYIDPYNKTQKAFLLGFNVGFDESFLRVFFKNAGDKYFGSYFWWPALDVAQIACHAMLHRRYQMKSFKLGNVAAAFGIEVDESRLHDSLYDVELTKGIYEAAAYYEDNEGEARDPGVDVERAADETRRATVG